jgi:hypothetical protein
MKHSSAFKRVDDRTIRLDPAPRCRTVASPRGRQGIVALFRTWIRRAPAERRLAARHQAGGGKLWLGWWDGNKVFTAVHAEVVNISRGGALVRTAEPPPELRELWVCLDLSGPGDCVCGSVLSVEPVRRGSWIVRFEFREPCPHRLLAASLAAPEHDHRAAKTRRRASETG